MWAEWTEKSAAVGIALRKSPAWAWLAQMSTCRQPPIPALAQQLHRSAPVFSQPAEALNPSPVVDLAASPLQTLVAESLTPSESSRMEPSTALRPYRSPERRRCWSTTAVGRFARPSPPRSLPARCRQSRAVPPASTRPLASSIILFKHSTPSSTPSKGVAWAKPTRGGNMCATTTTQDPSSQQGQRSVHPQGLPQSFPVIVHTSN